MRTITSKKKFVLIKTPLWRKKVSLVDKYGSHAVNNDATEYIDWKKIVQIGYTGNGFYSRERFVVSENN